MTALTSALLTAATNALLNQLTSSHTCSRMPSKQGIRYMYNSLEFYFTKMRAACYIMQGICSLPNPSFALLIATHMVWCLCGLACGVSNFICLLNVYPVLVLPPYIVMVHGYYRLVAGFVARSIILAVVIVDDFVVFSRQRVVLLLHQFSQLHLPLCQLRYLLSSLSLQL